MLTHDSYLTSRAFIEQHARPLEVARARHRFDGAPAELVLDELLTFQNDDGGFGHALEPDVRTNDSSALFTSIALNVVRSLGQTQVHAFVAEAIDYLLETLNPETGSWRIIPLSADRSPHAPWWNQAGRETSFDEFSLNPTAEILGYLFDYQTIVPRETLELVSRQVTAAIEELREIEMHDLLCCVRLLNTQNLPHQMRQVLTGRLAELALPTVELDAGKWSGYCLRPLQVVDAPDSPFIDSVRDAVAANLDFEIASCTDDGSWAPTWSWGEVSAEAWEDARREWSGILTFDKLTVLHRFGRITGVAS